MIQDYYRLLGLDEGASRDEIKWSFRQKAKELHPDINKSPTAHSEFTLLFEAYDTLTQLKTGKFKGADPSLWARPNEEDRWQHSYAERAKKRAAYYAKMDIREFEDSGYDQTLKSLDVVFDSLNLLIPILIWFVIPLILWFFAGLVGLISGLLLVVLTLPFTREFFRNSNKPGVKDLGNALGIIGKTKTFAVVIFTLINLILFLKFGLETLIPFLNLVLFMVGISGIMFLIPSYVFKNNSRNSAILSLCLTPLIINLLLMINYSFAQNAFDEYHSFTHEMQRTNHGFQKTSTIILNENKYDEYYGIRVFADFAEMEDKNLIKYTFKTGLFGFKIMSDYEFSVSE